MSPCYITAKRKRTTSEVPTNVMTYDVIFPKDHDIDTKTMPTLYCLGTCYNKLNAYTLWLVYIIYNINE